MATRKSKSCVCSEILRASRNVASLLGTQVGHADAWRTIFTLLRLRPCFLNIGLYHSITADTWSGKSITFRHEERNSGCSEVSPGLFDSVHRRPNGKSRGDLSWLIRAFLFSSEWNFGHSSLEHIKHCIGHASTCDRLYELVE